MRAPHACAQQGGARVGVALPAGLPPGGRRGSNPGGPDGGAQSLPAA